MGFLRPRAQPLVKRGDNGLLLTWRRGGGLNAKLDREISIRENALNAVWAHAETGAFGQVRVVIERGAMRVPVALRS